MTGKLNNKVVVITGAGSGMGKATAELFAAQGAKLVLADISGNQDKVAATIGSNAVAVHADVSKEDDIRNMIATAEQKFGRLDILVNNAGFGGKMMALHEQTTESWDRVHATNNRGVFFGLKHGIISMLKSGGGAIVNIGSASAVVGWKHHSIYGAAKAGVHQMTRVAALDYAQNNIRVNAIAPGTIWTGLVERSKQFPTPPPGTARLPGIPLDRWGLASDIANAALFLASDDSAYITGVVLPVDGGYCIGFSGMGAENTGPSSVNSDDK
jgi:NAD(P)-dependent dehydrogenase (short-subunit alcohol dehydrogenase family)